MVFRKLIFNNFRNGTITSYECWNHRGKNTIANLHVTPMRKYPEAKAIRVPDNIDGLNHSEMARWSPHRTRDMTTPAIMCHASASLNKNNCTEWKPESRSDDAHVDSYDCTGAVSLNSSMQTNVPEPYRPGNSSMHLNMPGGQWESGNKFIAEDMRSSHYLNNIKRQMSTKSEEPAVVVETQGKLDQGISKKEQLKRAFKEYGSVIVVFHVSISLMSLGTCYLLVSSGLDVVAILTWLGLGDNVMTAKIAAGTGTFVAAYALHKLFVPARMSLTLACTPFIVRHLRRIGFLKPPQSTNKEVAGSKQ